MGRTPLWPPVIDEGPTVSTEKNLGGNREEANVGPADVRFGELRGSQRPWEAKLDQVWRLRGKVPRKRVESDLLLATARSLNR